MTRELWEERFADNRTSMSIRVRLMGQNHAIVVVFGPG